MKICIDAGHGGADPGAVNGNYREKDAALAIALKVGKALAMAGAEVIYTRTVDKTVELVERTDYANAAGADYFVSIHLNAAAAKSAAGIETYSYNRAGASCELAEAVQKALVEATGAVDRGAKTANYHVLRETAMPAILVETGFISNNKEAGKLFTGSYQVTVSAAIAKAVAGFTGLKGADTMEKRYDRLEDIPAGEFRDTIKKLMDKGVIKGNAEGRLDLSYDMLRMFVMNYRAGLYK